MPSAATNDLRLVLEAGERNAWNGDAIAVEAVNSCAWRFSVSALEKRPAGGGLAARGMRPPRADKGPISALAGGVVSAMAEDYIGESTPDCKGFPRNSHDRHARSLSDRGRQRMPIS